MDAVQVNTSEEPLLQQPDQEDDEEDVGMASEQQLEICRVCLLGNPMMCGLFHENGEPSLSEKAMSFASVKIVPGDGLPSHICCDCSDKLESAYKFKLQVEQADSVLRERLDSLNIKDELFFSDVDVNLSSHRNVVQEITENSLLLKDHMDLLNVQTMSKGEDYSQIQDTEKAEIEKLDSEENQHLIQDEEKMQIQRNKEIHEVYNEQQIQDGEKMQIQINEEIHEIYNEQQIQDGEKMPIQRNEEIHHEVYNKQQIQSQESEEMQQVCEEQHNQSFETQELCEELHNQSFETQELCEEQHNQSFETQELQEIMLNEISEQERMQEAFNQTQQLPMHEHNYVAEAQPCEVFAKSNESNLEEMEQDSKENVEQATMIGEIQIHDVPGESFPTEATRRSKRKINQRKAQIDRDSDEENYFENLNLSSRLKKVQSEKSEKIYFVCYLCDKQFLTKDVLKEHMYSHEEVRKTISFAKKSTEKPQKTPEKSQQEAASPASLKPPSSGKRPSTCPHCGKEYLYIISFNKHLRQHEREKLNESKEESMPLEVSFQEDDESLDFQGYEDNPAQDSDGEEDVSIKKEDEVPVENELKKHSLKCNICEGEFDEMDNLRDHRAQHVVEGVLTEQDLQDDIKLFEVLDVKNDKDEDEQPSESSKEDSKPLKCPHCPAVYAQKKSLARHVESHGGKYTCKLCHQSFTRKDHLRRHAEQHGNWLNSFRCTQCNKNFGNELTLRNHLIATNHKTMMHGQEYDPNKRIKRVAAKAAQRIIDQIKTDLNSDEFEDEDRDGDSEFVKVEHDLEDEETENTSPAPKKQRTTKQLFCATCNQKYPSKQALARHMERHVKDENAVKQENIKKPEESRENEDNDDDIEEDDDDFEGGLDWPMMDNHECPTCKKRYSTKKSLLRHQLLHEEPNFECDICNVKFYRKDKLKAHYDKCSEKNPDQVRKCNICGDTFENNEILKEHRAKHVTEGILTEEDLREIEPRPEDRNAEKAKRTRRTDIVGLECTECNKRYTSRKGLLRHIQVHEGKKYLCDICPKKFYRREHLKIHVAKHNMVKPYKCPRCTKRFIKEEQLNNHILKHDKSSSKKPKTDSDTSKRFLCEICSKSFTQSTTLIAHLRAHNGIKPYVCEVCSRPFTTNAYLKMHMRTHTQERPYICQYCSRAFARADTLANHLTSHTGEAKYHCKYCPKHFRRLKSLKEHVFIHTGQRPYACPTCDRRFNNNGSRYAHSKRCKQNVLQITPSEITVQTLNVSQEEQEMHDMQELQEQQEQEDQQHHFQLHQEQQEQMVQSQLQPQLQPQRIHQATISQAQIIKPQNIKTITITRPDGGLTQQHLMSHQEILMPLILPLTVTLTDMGEEVILPEGTKIFTT